MIRGWFAHRVLAISQIVYRVATGIAVAAKAARMADVVPPLTGAAAGSGVFEIPAIYRRQASPVSFSGDVELASGGSGQRITARVVDQDSGEIAELAKASERIAELEAEVTRYEQAHQRGLDIWMQSLPGGKPSIDVRPLRRAEMVVWLLRQLEDGMASERKDLEEATAAYETACRERASMEQQLKELRAKYDDLKHDRDDLVEAIEGRDDARMIAKFATPLLRAGDLLGKVGALVEVPDAIAKLQAQLEQARRDRDAATANATRYSKTTMPVIDVALDAAAGDAAATKHIDGIVPGGIGFWPSTRYMMLCLQLRDLERMELGSSWLADVVREESDVLWREPVVRSFMGDDDRPRHTGGWEPKFERGDPHTRLRDLLARAVRTHADRVG